jgi:hypothetical protein
LLLALAQDAINSRHPCSRVAAKTLSMNVKTRRWKDGTGRVGRKRARSSRLAVEPTEDQHVAGPEGIEQPPAFLAIGKARRDARGQVAPQWRSATLDGHCVAANQN